MGSERELSAKISRIGKNSSSVEDAVELIQSLLARELGSSTLLLDLAVHGISPRAAKSVSEFLDSREFPFRGLYTAPLIVANKTAGRLIACFGSFESPSELPQRLTAHIAEQFGQLLARTHSGELPRAEVA